MSKYVGLDVSLEETHLCVVGEDGATSARDVSPTDPDALAGAIRRLAPHPKLVVLETGGQSNWLHQKLTERGIPAVILDARQARQALSGRINKTDMNDAEGLAQLARTGWYKEVLSKRPETRKIRAMLNARTLLVRQRCDLSNQVRSMLRASGLKMGRTGRQNFAQRALALAQSEPDLMVPIRPLLAVHGELSRQIDLLDQKLNSLARKDKVARRLMSVPGVGSLTALTFMTAIDCPERFARSADVGAYLGLTSRRYQSGEIDRSGRISKQGDSLTRAMLYEAANAMMTRVRRWTREKAWALRLSARRGSRKARVALARKLAVILHRIWLDGSTYKWSNEAG